MKDFTQFSLDDWLDYTQKQNSEDMEFGLDRIEEVWQAMDAQKPDFVITVAGTNGKGSSVSMLEAVYRQGGKRTGSYTSPHLVCFNERIKINGQPASDEDICRGFCEIERYRGETRLTFFEFGVLCALWVFDQQDVEIGILEVGLGGRLDAVNIIENDIALITTIDFDHQEWLGSDREKIGAEKAGVIKQGRLAISNDPDPPKSIAQTAEQKAATLLQLCEHYQVGQNEDGIVWKSEHSLVPDRWKYIDKIHLSLDGDHQIQNLAGVIAALALSESRTGIKPDDLRNGLAHISLQARCQVIRHSPEVIIDVAHNAQSAEGLAKFLKDRPHPGGRTLGVLGVLNDKDIDAILDSIIDEVDIWHLATLDEGERGQSADQLAKKMWRVKENILTVFHDSPIEAYNAALSESEAQDRLVIFGSFHTVGDIIAHIQTDQAKPTA